MARNENLTEVKSVAPSLIERWAYKPRFGVVLYGDAGDAVAAERSAQSVKEQIYADWTLIENPECSIGAAAAAAKFDFLIPLRIGDALSEAALFRFGEALQAGGAQVLYGDEDRLDANGERIKPWFKPRWNRELFLAQDYLHRAVAIDAALVQALHEEQAVGSVAELLLRAVTATSDDAILHIPHVLSHVGIAPLSASEERRPALCEYLAAVAAQVTPGPHDTNRISWPLPSPLPLISIIVPTKDKLELLRPCVETVLQRTDYPNFELVVVDNLSVEAATKAYLAELSGHPRVRVLEYAKPYNFSAINNFAASQASGTFLCLLNNDTEVVETSWLTEMMRYAVRPEVGAVGAKLLYEDETIQHAGVVVGMGGAAGHAHRFEANASAGYFALPHVAHFVSAVTAACLLVAKSKFEAVGGLDAATFAVAFNDVDLCLKLDASGWKNVYVPQAVLIHHESKSRGSDLASSQIQRYRAELRALQDRWGTVDYDDPVHNPNLDRASEQYVIRL